MIYIHTKIKKPRISASKVKMNNYTVEIPLFNTEC